MGANKENIKRPMTRPGMNLADPELELIDPTPDVFSLFLHFDKIFFWTRLANRAVVRWSKRMYSCAGTCTYDRGGLCDIALSEPLLKLRPRKDLVETLLHEMIHAFLFITNRDRDRDGHGPNFQAHMKRINNAAGLNISIYHDFHDEVKLYLTHVWRCNGPCQHRRPHFGIIRRSNNRAPGPYDYWFQNHQTTCGGKFIKIKEPDPKPKKKKIVPVIKKAKVNGFSTTGFEINSNTKPSPWNTKPKDKPTPVEPGLDLTPQRPVSNESTTRPKTNNSSFTVPKRGVGFNPTATNNNTETQTASVSDNSAAGSNMHLTDSRNVTEQVRSIWANKFQTTSPVAKSTTGLNHTVNASTSNNATPNRKHKAGNDLPQTPPAKMKKIDDYFKANTILKNLYGDDIQLKQPENSSKLIAVNAKEDKVPCPVCNGKINSEEINRHLDECLNKEVIEQLTQENGDVVIDASIPRASGGSETFQARPSTSRTSVSGNVNTPQASERSILITEELLRAVRNDVTGPLKRPEDIKKEPGDNETSRPIDLTTLTEPRPGTSRESDFNSNEVTEQECPCCGEKIGDADEHLEECTALNNTLTPRVEGVMVLNSTIVIDDKDDEYDESHTLNATGTKTPCPCCLRMVEHNAMNYHLDLCLGLT